MLDSLLDRLARQRGIGDAYHNYRGELLHISRETKTAILAAMGCATSDAAAVERQLQGLEIERWRLILPPVAVAHPGRDGTVVNVPANDLESSVAWSVVTAQGRTLSGAVRAADLREFERAEIEGRWITRRALPLPADLPHGVYRLMVETVGGKAEAPLIVAPGTCHEPRVLRDGNRLWGVAVQLYSLRSGRNWGIGDFADLEQVVRECAAHGASFIGLNPLHALFPANAAQFSPYSPSSRHFLNVLYVAIDQLPEFEQCQAVRMRVEADEFQAHLRQLRATTSVDYAGVTAAKLEVLRELHACFRREHVARKTPRALAFDDYRVERGESLRLHALHDAIDEHLRRLDPSHYWGWPVWPEGLREPNGVDVCAFEAGHTETVEFYAWLQWLADTQLGAVQRLARDLGMPIGLYGDFAVGVNPCGAETWSDPALYRKGAGVGAPPDALALKGQDWGIPPQDPNVLTAEGYRPFEQLIAANMRHFGALRLDHVMALYRQWWVPSGLGSTDGGYVHYPVDDLLSVLTLQSVRHHCVVIGEDLGTVPPEMSQLMRERFMYSYRVLLFEKRADGSFLPPAAYPRRAIATVTTHDLPTLKGYWSASDIDLRQRLGLYPNADVHQMVVDERKRDRRALLAALEEQGLRPQGATDAPDSDTDELAHAIHVYLARSASALVVLQAEDLIGMTDPVNVPGTSDEHANWQRKMSEDLEVTFARDSVQCTLRAVQAARRD